jgi:hypothetical protein
MVSVAPTLSAPASVCFTEYLFQLVGLGQQRFDPGPVQAAKLIELKPFAHPVKQLYIKLALQFFEGTAGGRLRHGKRFSRPGNILKLRSGKKNFQLPETVFHCGTL